MAKRNVGQYHRDHEIAHLKNELFFAQHAILDLMPADMRELLLSYYHVELLQAAEWLPGIADQLVAKAELLPKADRAYCPLCGGGSSAPGAEGFSVPLGLTRHLIGWGNVTQCPVTRAAIGLAKEHWNEHSFPKFG